MDISCNLFYRESYYNEMIRSWVNDGIDYCIMLIDNNTIDFYVVKLQQAIITLFNNMTSSDLNFVKEYFNDKQWGVVLSFDKGSVTSADFISFTLRIIPMPIGYDTPIFEYTSQSYRLLMNGFTYAICP